MHDIWEHMLSVYNLLVVSTHIQKSPQKVRNWSDPPAPLPANDHR